MQYIYDRLRNNDVMFIYVTENYLFRLIAELLATNKEVRHDTSYHLYPRKCADFISGSASVSLISFQFTN